MKMRFALVFTFVLLTFGLATPAFAQENAVFPVIFWSSSTAARCIRLSGEAAIVSLVSAISPVAEA